MVCSRCKTIVKSELVKLGIPYISVELGEAITNNKITVLQIAQLSDSLRHSGFELVDQRKNRLIERLKQAINDLAHYSDENLKMSYSDYIRLIVKDNHISLNTLFAELKSISIEKHIINHKIELVKKLLLNNELNLAEIAVKMHYSNVAQLSSQFKSITGLTPFNFRLLQSTSNKNNEDV